MNLSELATIPTRLQDLENTVAEMANRLHEVEPQPLAEDDEVNMKEEFDWASLTNENHQLCIANQILHDKVRGLRDENQRLADICEELAASLKRERQYVTMLTLGSVCNA